MTSYIYDMVDTWNAGATTFTAVKMNVTDTASAASSLLMDLQTNSTPRFQVKKFNATEWGLAIGNNGILSFGSQLYFRNAALSADVPVNASQFVATSASGVVLPTNAVLSFTDAFLTRRAAANLRLGAADAATAVAQTLSVQSGTAGASALSCSISGTTLTVGGAVTGTIAIGHAVTGTGVSAGTLITAGSGTTWTVNNSQTVSSTTMYFNSVGRDFTITGSQASGPSPGGSIVFQVAPAGAAGTTAQNALATALTIGGSQVSTFRGPAISSILVVQANDPTANGSIELGTGSGSSTGFVAWKKNDGTRLGYFGLSATNVQLNLENSAAFSIAGGNLIFNADNQYDIGASGANRPRNVYAAGSYSGSGYVNGSGGYFYWNNRSTLSSPADGQILIANLAVTDFNRLQFGGTTSSFPALKRSSTTLQARLADDSAFAPVQGKLTTETAYTAGAPTATGYLIIYDSNGTAYRVPAVAN